MYVLGTLNLYGGCMGVVCINFFFFHFKGVWWLYLCIFFGTLNLYVACMGAHTDCMRLIWVKLFPCFNFDAI